MEKKNNWGFAVVRRGRNGFVKTTSALLAAGAMALGMGLAPSMFVSSANAAVGQVPPATDPTTVPKVSIAIVRTDSLGDTVSVGDTLTYNITYRNNSDRKMTVYPMSSNLADTAVQGSRGGCRWQDLQPGTTKVCTKRTHTVTAADIAHGFQPTSVWKIADDRAGTQVWEGYENIIVNGPDTVTVQPSPAILGDGTVTTDFVRIRMVRTDQGGTPLTVGDKVKYTIEYENLSDAPLTVYPIRSNLQDVAVGDAKNCRWANLDPQTPKECTLAYHVVNKADIENGFQPEITWKVTQDREGAQVLPGQENLVTRVSTPIQVQAGVDPATVPTDRAAGEGVVLARAGFEGYPCFRIPALTVAPDGSILAAMDGRRPNCADAPNPNSIVLRRSLDGGRSFTELETIAAGHEGADKYGYSDPSFVVDHETGKIFAFFVKSFDVSFQGSRPGVSLDDRNVLHAAVVESTDNGVHWSEPRIITTEINADDQQQSRFATSGEGIQIRAGQYKGRLVQQFVIKVGGVYQAMSVYSDDHGATWKHGEPVGTGMDENKVVELADGRLMLNSRRSDNSVGRKVAYSNDGGQTWTDLHNDTALTDPKVNGSIIRAYPNAPADDPHAQILLFANSNSPNSRSNGYVRVSYDSGQTWTEGRQFKAGAMAYVSLTALPESGHWALLYESDNNDIVYTQIDEEWLGIPADGLQDMCVPQRESVTTLRVNGDVPAQSGEGPELMVDGNTETKWHSPWNSTVNLPLTINLTPANGAAVEANDVVLTPRRDSSNNGAPKRLEVLAGPDADHLETLREVTAAAGEVVTIPVTGKIGAIRLVIKETYGDVPNKFASMAEVQLTRNAPAAGCHRVEVTDGTIVSGVNKQGFAYAGRTVTVRAPEAKDGVPFKLWRTTGTAADTSSFTLEKALARKALLKFEMPAEDVRIAPKFAHPTQVQILTEAPRVGQPLRLRVDHLEEGETQVQLRRTVNGRTYAYILGTLVRTGERIEYRPAARVTVQRVEDETAGVVAGGGVVPVAGVGGAAVPTAALAVLTQRQTPVPAATQMTRVVRAAGTDSVVAEDGEIVIDIPDLGDVDYGEGVPKEDRDALDEGGSGEITLVDSDGDTSTAGNVDVPSPQRKVVLLKAAPNQVKAK